MTDSVYDRTGEVPTLEVRVSRHGSLVHRELCESEEQAQLVLDTWSDVEDVECEIRQLSRRRSDDDTEVEPVEPGDVEYPEAVEMERDARDLSGLEG